MDFGGPRLALGGGTAAPGTTAGATRQFGDSQAPEGSAWTLRMERGMVESGGLVGGGRWANANTQGQVIVSATRDLDSHWELRLGGRVDGQWQDGRGRDLSDLDVDYDETWLRYRGEDMRLTLGAQKILWGRVDEVPPTDRLSTADLTRFALDELAFRRRASPAVRLEWYRDDWTVDAVWLPKFRAAELPDADSIWHPVDRQAGRILGLPDDPVLAGLVRSGTFREENSGSGGGGIRLSRHARGLDYAVTVQRARHSAPYYRLDDVTRAALAGSGEAIGTPVFTAVHPRTWVVGGDLGLEVGSWIVRMEAAWLSDVPVTRADFSQDTVRGLEWVVGGETYPGDRDLRLTLQLAGRHLWNSGDVLDRTEAYYLNGEVESPFAHGQWRARLRFWTGLNVHDVYLNPELAWTAHEPHEFYVGLHWMDGESDSLGGFYRDRRIVVAGWRGRF